MLAIVGFGLVLLALAFEPGVVPNVLLYSGALLVSAFTFAPSLIYRLRSGRRAPAHFSSEIVDYLRKPTHQIAKRQRDVIGYSAVSLLRSFADDRRRIPTTTSPRLSEFQFFDVRTRAERFERPD